MTGLMNLPKLPTPIPRAIHPYADIEHPMTDRFDKATLEYCDRFRMYDSDAQRERLSRIGNARLATLLFPAGSEELLQTGSDFVVWAFAFDDEYCDEGPISKDPVLFSQKAGEIMRAIDCPEDPRCNQDRYGMAIRDIRQRLDRLAKPAAVARYVNAFHAYIKIEALKITNLNPSLNDYLYLRLHGGGGTAFPMMSHVLAGVDITDDEYEDRRVRALGEMSALIAALDTDVTSYQKEEARAVNGKEHNIVQILCRDDCCSPEEAIRRYVEMRWRMMSLFVRLSDDVRQDASPGIRQFVELLQQYYVGSTIWAVANNRYGSISGLQATELFDGGEMIDECPPESFESIGVPSCDWWWAYDPARRSVRPDGSRKKPVAVDS